MSLCKLTVRFEEPFWIGLVETEYGGMDWQPFSGHFFQRLRPAFLNSTGLM